MNRSGKHAICLEVWALDKYNCHINTETQNDTETDDAYFQKGKAAEQIAEELEKVKRMKRR